MSDLPALRNRIDTLDNQLVKLLNERAQVSINIGLVKKGAANAQQEGPSHVHVPAREIAVYDKVEAVIRKLNHGPLTNEAVEAIYREIMSASISLQRDISIAFLGPRGSYSQTAAFLRFGDSVTYADQLTIRDVFRAVESGATTYGVVPFENSTLGSVGQTLDAFIASSSLTENAQPGELDMPSSAPSITLRSKVMIRAEIYLPIHHCLLSKASSLGAVKKIYSHPEALGQVAKWCAEKLRGVERVAVASTSYAAELASMEPDAAAVCNIVCSEMYGLNVLAKDIEDMKNNTTRFFIIGDKTEAPTNDDRTLMYFTVDHRLPGALCDVLNVFKDQGINLTKIDSRPSGMMPWHYFFFVEFEGHMHDAKAQTAIKGMKPFVLSLRVLGSYPNQRPAQ
ncbi:hypothetical protein HDU67_006547 [Dinochytrium kinnereticum]|nr:hypothetical protein HDU67_006547 [Dinochytrium kinnereticum]